MINLLISEVGQQSSSQSLKTLGDQRAPVRLASQSTYFREQRGIGLENVEQSLLGKGLGTIFHPKGTCSHHSTVPKPHEILPSLVLIYTSNFKRFGSLDLESSIVSAETHTHTLTHSHSHTHTHTHTHTPFLCFKNLLLNLCVLLYVLSSLLYLSESISNT